MPSKRNIPTENLRRSSRAELLKQKAEAQKAIAAQKPEPQVRKKPLKRKRMKSEQGIAETKNSEFAQPPQDDDDGFIPDDTAADPTPTPPTGFDELELWKQYQQFGGDASDDGFIPDDDAVSDPGTRPIEDPPGATTAPISNRHKSKHILRREHKANNLKKLSKKKRRKRERKWLKKLFHESVVIAEPQYTDREQATGGASAPSEDQESITLPVPGDGGIFQRTNEDTAHPSNSNGTLHPTALTNGDYGAYPQCGNNSPRSSEQAANVNGFLLHGADVQDRKTNKSHNDWDRLQQSSGLSRFDFTQHLLKLYRDNSLYHTPTPSTKQSDESTNRQEVSTRFIDLTSGKSETGDRKKRYKMELSLPEGTTILVTNLVQRESSLPKVIFMLKKSSPDGVNQGTPLLVECSGEASTKHQGQAENQKALQQEIQGISRQFLQLPKAPESVFVPKQPTPVPKAISCSMDSPKK